jgi:predicted DNA-binding protein (MmcQ/YjbR family)
VTVSRPSKDPFPATGFYLRIPGMNIDWVRKLCLAFPGATEQTVWEGDLTFKVAGKMFAHTVLEVAPVWLSFKCSPENFAELTERAGIIPAPYLARAQWIALETKDALPPDELTRLIRESYDMVVAKLPRKTRDTLSAGSTSKKPARKQASARKNPPAGAKRKNAKKKSA